MKKANYFEISILINVNIVNSFNIEKDRLTDKKTDRKMKKIVLVMRLIHGD